MFEPTGYSVYPSLSWKSVKFLYWPLSSLTFAGKEQNVLRHLKFPATWLRLELWAAAWMPGVWGAQQASQGLGRILPASRDASCKLLKKQHPFNCVQEECVFQSGFQSGP